MSLPLVLPGLASGWALYPFGFRYGLFVVPVFYNLLARFTKSPEWIDGMMAFIRSPDKQSIELLQKGAALAPKEPWTSMANTGHW